VLLTIDTIKRIRAYYEKKNKVDVREKRKLWLKAMGNLLGYGLTCLVVIFFYGLVFFILVTEPEMQRYAAFISVGLLAGLYGTGVGAALGHARWRIREMAHILPAEEMAAHIFKIPESEQGNILGVVQTKSILPAKFEVRSNNTHVYAGQYSRISSAVAFAHTLTGQNGSLIYKTKSQTFDQVANLMPLGWARNRSRIYTVTGRRSGEVAKFERIRDSFFSGYYLIQHKGLELRLYDIGKGINEYVLIFLNDKQIGQICKENIVYNNLDRYLLFLLEEYVDFAPLLSLFILYYDGFHHPTRPGKLFRREWTWSFHKYRKLYNPKWLQTHFKI